SAARSLAPLLLEFSNCRQHLLVDTGVGRQHAAAARVIKRTVNSGDAPSGLLNQERPGRDVPGMKLLLPETLEPAGRHVAKIQGCRSQPAHGPRPGDEFREEAHQL